eukprot:52458-Rhodomonas_salina.2
MSGTEKGYQVQNVGERCCVVVQVDPTPRNQRQKVIFSGQVVPELRKIAFDFALAQPRTTDQVLEQMTAERRVPDPP